MESTVGCEDVSTCTKCGGSCCKRFAGLLFPEDLGESPEEIKEEFQKRLTSKLYTIDMWDGGLEPELPNASQVYFVRPAHVDGRWPTDPSWGGTCVFLTDSGCKLTLAERPIGCRMLKPEEKACDGPEYGKGPAAVAWIPYQQMIEEFLSDMF